MPISEGRRSDLYTGLTETIGQANAETLMSVLSFYELDEVATKGDFALLRADIEVLKGETAGLRGEMADLRGEFRGEIAELRREIAELRKTMYRLSYSTLLIIIGAMAAFQFAG